MHDPSTRGASWLLSRREERDLIEAPLLRRLPHRNELFTPSSRFYDDLTQESTIVDSIREIYRWLGAKPARIHIDLPIDKDFDHDSHTFVIPRDFLTQPYQLAALLTLAVIRNVLTSRLKDDPSESLVETTSIETGLGAVVLNGITKQPKFAERWRAHKTGHHHRLLVLHAYTPANYAEALGTYCHESKIDGANLMAQLTKAGASYMPQYYLQQMTTPRRDPNIIRQQRRHAHISVYKVIASGLIAGMIAALCIFIYAQRPYTPSAAVRDQYDTTQLLANSYQQCIDKVRKQQNAYAQDDIFIERGINADAARCVSLRNRYNYEVGVYNHLLEAAP